MTGISSTGIARSITNTAASGGREVLMLHNSTITKSQLLPATRQITIRARGDQCAGPPIMVVKVDGVQVMSTGVSTNTFADYSAAVNMAAGMRSISVSYVNNYEVGCNRNLRVDKLTFSPDGDEPAAASSPPAAAAFEAESMSGISSTGIARSITNTAASGGREVLMLHNSTITKSQLLPATRQITIRARGDQCAGPPIMVVKVDGVQVMSTGVSTNTFADYSAAVNMAAGMRSISVSYVNNYEVGCNRNLRVDKVALSGE